MDISQLKQKKIFKLKSIHHAKLIISLYNLNQRRKYEIKRQNQII